MGLTLTVLGSSGSYPGAGRACSGYLVRTARTTLWLDAGSGTFANLQRHVRLADVDAIVLTHEHPDHCSDLTGAYVAARYHFELDALKVLAPASVREAAYYRDEPLDWHTVADGAEVEIGDATLRFSRTDHPPETLAVRIDGGGRRFVYSSDTGPHWSLGALGQGADLVLCEATYLSDHPDAGSNAGHLTARQAGEQARAASARRLVLTHLQPGVDIDAAKAEARAAFGASVDVALEGQEYEL